MKVIVNMSQSSGQIFEHTFLHRLDLTEITLGQSTIANRMIQP